MGDYFDVAFWHALGIETDKYTNDPVDHGGPTKFGITLETLKRVLRADADFNHDGVVNADDVKLLKPEAAKMIYRREYWDAPGFAKLSDEAIAVKTFDLGVHGGPATAVAVLQRAANEAKPPGVASLKIDGRLGPKTLDAVNHFCDRDILLHAFCAEQASLYLAIIAEDPTQARFKNGWLARARWPFQARRVA